MNDRKPERVMERVWIIWDRVLDKISSIHRSEGGAKTRTEKKNETHRNSQPEFLRAHSIPRFDYDGYDVEE